MGIKPSDLSVLPADWKAIKFGVITKVRQGLQIAISERLTKPTLTSKEYITIQSINRQNQGREYVESPSARVTCQSDDVLMTRTGNTGIVVTGVEGAFHNNFFLIDFDRKELDSIFLVNYLRSPRVQHVLLTKAGASTIPDLNHKDFYSIDFPLAPLPEQKKIAQILSTWDKAITTTEQLLANSQQQKKALMQQLLTGKKRLLDDNGVRFGGEWKAVEIGRVLKEVKRPVDWDDDAEYKLLSVKRRSEGVVLREVLKGSAILTKKMNVAHSGDFLISKMQIVHGAAGLVSDEFDGFHVSGSYISLISKDESKLNIHFFAWFAKQKLMYHKAFLCSYGVHIEKMTFNFKLFLKEKIRIPFSIEEQLKIATVLSSADQEISALQQKLDALKQEKKALMQQLLTGKRRVLV